MILPPYDAISRGRIGQRPDSGERISYEAPLLDDIAARLDLRVPNREATEAIIRAMEAAGDDAVVGAVVARSRSGRGRMTA